MAQENNSVITSLRANSYSGEFNAPVDNLVVYGQFNTNSEKVIGNINGNVKRSGTNTPIVTFSAYKNGDTYRYNFSDISDLTVLTAAAAAIGTAIAEVEAELEADD